MTTLEFDCYECEGKGSYKLENIDEHVDCFVCKGTGKLDWVDNIVPIEKFGMATLKKANLYRMIQHVKNTIVATLEEFMFEPFSEVKSIIDIQVMKPLQDKKGILSYDINTSQNTMSVSFKFDKYIESIKMIFKVN